jgi:hypothetical protein
MRLLTLPSVSMVLCAPLLMGFGTARCDELLERASAELRHEQYPTMLTLAQERQLLCPGPESSFLAGVAHANMVDHLLVADDDRPLMLEQALSELRGAVRDVRPEWRQTALSWISYLDALPDTSAPPEPGNATNEAPSLAAAAAEPKRPRRAAPPWEPNVFPWGPVLLGSSGAVLLTAGLITYLGASHLDAEVERADRACTNPCGYLPPSRLQLDRDQGTARTLYVSTDVLLVAGAASLTGALVWSALRHTPSDPTSEVSVAPWLGGAVAGAQAVGRF